MGASTDPCGTPRATAADEDFSFPGSLPVCGCSESFSPIPGSSLAYRSGGVWLPGGGEVLCQTPLRSPAAQRRPGHRR